MMKIELDIQQNLVDLAEIFKQNGYSLYIVGGFVRNALMGFCETDIDICSSATPQQVQDILKGTEYHCVLVNPELGTLLIYNKDKEVEYEHTTFRAEKYAAGGVHSPSEVEFVSDMALDASRRDFSANALYYDICSQKIYDFYDGIESIRHRLLKTVETPERVFTRDGLRILRMARIASELNFEIEKETFLVAKKLVAQLADISQERFNKELVSMIFADNKYQSIINYGIQTKGLQILGGLGAWRYVLTAFYDTLDSDTQQKFDDILWDLLSIAPPALRISAMCIDMLSFLGVEATEQNIQLILGTKGVMLNKKEVSRQVKIIQAYFAIKNGALTTEKMTRLFLQANYDCLKEIFGLCKLAGIGQNVMKVSTLMQMDNVPFSLKQLAINGNDIREVYPDILPREYSKILNNLLQICAVMPELNEKEKLLQKIPQIS